MSITAAWHDEERTIVLQIYTGSWTWDEFYQVGEQTRSLMQSVEHRVDVVADYTHTKSIPVGGAITHARNVLSNMPPHWGGVVVVSTNRLILLLVSTFTKVFPTNLGRRTYSAPSVEEAVKLISSLRSRATEDDEDETLP